MASMGDCEALRDGVLAQPVNALTSLAYIGAAAWILSGRRAGDRGMIWMYGCAVLITGIGSLDYHGPQSPVSGWLHDLGVAAPLWTIVVHRLGGGPKWAAASITSTGLLLALLPQAGTVVGAALGLAVAVGELTAGRGGPVYRLAVAAVLVGAAAHWAGRTGSPLCDPGSVWQAHGLWHLLSATALACWGRAVLTAPRKRRQPLS
jgi:hypothetical protein